MSTGNIAVVSPGDMGHVVGEVISRKGYRVITSLEGRSDVSCQRAAAAQMQDVGSLETLITEADIILSIMPPENALAFARVVAAIMDRVGVKLVFADCNAVSPRTTQVIGSIMEEAGAVFVKIGIVGPPPREGVTTRFYASGSDTHRLSFLDGNGISYRTLGNDITRAAALKMCYAGLNKGTMTLHTAVLTVAERLGIREELQEEISSSQKFHWEMMNERVPFYAADAGRWAGEMDEISETFKEAGVSGNLHKGSGEIFRLLDSTPLAKETRETMDKTRTLDEAIKIYAAAARSVYVPEKE